MEKPGQQLDLTKCRLALALFPCRHPFFLYLQPLRNAVHTVAALLARPREKRRIHCYGLIFRHNKYNLTGIPRGCQPSQNGSELGKSWSLGAAEGLLNGGLVCSSAIFR